MIERKKVICGMCQNKCAVEVTLTDGRLTDIIADVDSPKGRICPRGKLSPEMLYGEQRIQYPMIRTGEKGEGKFRRATWEEALDLIEEKCRSIIDRFGAKALASYTGGSLLEESYMQTVMRGGGFWRHLGSPNDMMASSTCNFSSYTLTMQTTFGLSKHAIPTDLSESDAVFIWGKNSKTDSGPLSDFNQVMAMKKRGGKVVVIDPRGLGMAEHADLWIPIIPGADGALALAMLKIIIEEDRYDHDFVEQYTQGFDDLKAYVATLTLEQCAAWTGVSIPQIRQLTDLFCSTEKIGLISYTGLEYQLSGVQNNRAIQCLWAITGKIDVPGGLYLNAYGAPTMPLRKPDQPNHWLGAEKYPLFYGFLGQSQFIEFPKAVLEDDPYPIRALMIGGTSPIVTYPERKLWEDVYKKLELFIVNERFWSHDCLYADVILPVTTLFENLSSCSYGDLIRLRERVIEPVGEARSDLQIYRAIAERLGFGDKFPKDDDELLARLFRGREPLLEKLKAHPEGIPIPQRREYRKYASGQLRQDGRPGFPTPSGKFEISSTYLRECGYTGHPEYHDIREIEALNGAPGQFPMMMTTGARSGVRFSSFGPNIPGIAAIEPKPLMDICAADAETLGIADGEPVTIETAIGKKDFHARICPMAPGTIHVMAGGGSAFQTEAWRSSNVNDLCTLEYRDPLCGFITYKSVPCRILKK